MNGVKDSERVRLIPTTNHPVVVSNQLLSTEDVAKWLQVSRAWVTSHANGSRRPHLPSVKLGACVRFKREDIERFIEQCERQAVA
jgi:predicted DNA-binding transcriptional regulator AlpA